jgi:adenosine deaminase
MSSHPATQNHQFAQALLTGDLAALQKVPKSDLHNHSILGTRIERVEAWFNRSLQRPKDRMTSLDEMIKYAHEVLYPHTDTLAGFQFTAQSALEDAIQDGVTILEMSMDVRFISLFVKGSDSFLTFVGDLVKNYKNRLDFRPEIGMSKDRSAAEQIRLATACIQSGLFKSIDLYGNETAQSPDAYKEIYAEAKKHGLKLKAHAGEFAGPENISRTLDILQVEEVQHGITAASSKPLMERLRGEHVRLNICPSSNVALGVVSDIAHHPIRVLADNGVKVTINSDDLMIFGKSVSQEYMVLYQCGVFTVDELDEIRREGLSSER